MTELHKHVPREELKYTILQYSRSYSSTEIAKLVGIPEKEVRKLQDEALKDIQAGNLELGRAYAMLHLQKIEHCERLMMRFIDQFEKAAQLTAEGNITDEAARAAELVMKSVDRLEKLLTRGSKLLGLDAPIKLQGVMGVEQAPDRVLNAALSVDGDPTSTDETDLGDRILEAL